MDVIGKRKFVRELVQNVQADILAKVDQMPDDWDGHELRRYVADKFNESASWPTHGKTPYARRRSSYRNTVAVFNL